jgi:hypothetical protein
MASILDNECCKKTREINKDFTEAVCLGCGQLWKQDPFGWFTLDNNKMWRIKESDVSGIEHLIEAGKRLNEAPFKVEMAMVDGDLFTVSGLRQRKDGSFATRCRPGNETVFRAEGIKE